MPQFLNGASRDASGQSTGLRLPAQLFCVLFRVLLVTLVAAIGTSVTAAVPYIVHVGDPHHPGALSVAVQKAYAAGAHEIVINPGVYHLPATGHPTFHLKHWQNICISAKQVELIMRVAHAGVCFDLDHCRNVILDGPTISQTRVTFYQGRIIQITPASGGYNLDWKPDAGYPEPKISDKHFPTGFDVVNGRTRHLRVGSPDIGTAIHSAEAHGVFRLFFRMKRPKFKVGDWLVARWGNPRNKILLDHSHNCTIQHVTLMRNGFAPIFEAGGGGNHLLYCHWVLGPKPAGATESPVVTNQADGFHSVGANPGTDIEHCVFKGVFLDDCIAIHGEFQTVLRATGNTIRVKDNRNSGLTAGQPIQISNKEGFFATGLVLAVQKNSDQTSTVILNHNLSVPVGSYVTNPDRCGQGYRVIDCLLGDTRSRGMLLKGSNGLVIGNTVRGCGMAGISIGPEFWWHEAGYCHNVIVEDNHLIRDGKGGHGGYFSAVYVHGDGAVGNSDIVIRHNTFVSNFAGDIFMQWTGSGQVADNTFTGPPLLSATGDRRPAAIAVRNCGPIQLGHNTITNPTAYAPAAKK